MPSPELDVAQDETGYSAEVTLELDLAVSEFDAFSEACLHVSPIVRVEGEHRLRGLVSVDEDTPVALRTRHRPRTLRSP